MLDKLLTFPPSRYQNLDEITVA